MITAPNSVSSSNGSKPLPMAPKKFDPDEIRRIAEARGYFGGRPVPVKKDGADVAQFDGARVLMIDVTPELAALWLKNNFKNRPLREDTVKAYARDMINKVWVATHQGIAFNDQDQLIDGQHRLHAVLMANVTVRMMVTFGLPEKIEGSEMTTMDAVDRGATRTVGDQLLIQHGIKYGSLTASICAAIASICFGDRTRRLSVGQTLEVYREFESSVDYVILHKSKAIGLRSAGVLAGFAFAMQVDPKSQDQGGEIVAMFTNLNTGENLKPGSAIAALRAFLTSDEAKLFTRSLDRGLAELILQAIYLEQQGKPVEKLEMSLEGAEHFKALQATRVEKIGNLFRLPKNRRDAETQRPLPSVDSVPSVVKPSPERPTLEKILRVVEQQFGVSRLILGGRGDDQDVSFPRGAFVTLAISLGHPASEIGPQIRRSVDAVQSLNWPKKMQGPKQVKALADLKGKL